MWPGASASRERRWRRGVDVVLLLGTLGVAYLQARGAMRLLGARLSVDLRSHQLAPPASKAASPPRVALKSASLIYARNPFDSKLRALSPNAAPVAAAQATSPPLPLDPLRAPACADLTVTIVSTTLSPLHAVAAVKETKDPQPPRLVHLGDRIGAAQVVFIGDNPLTGSPTVWLEQASVVCQLALFGLVLPPVAAVESTTTATEAPSAMPTFAQPGQTILDNGPKLQARAASPDIAARIKRVGADEFEVDRRVLASALENQSDLSRELRLQPDPAAPGGGVLRAVGVRSSTLLGLLGFSNGDVLLRVNGQSLAAAESVLQVYGKLQTSAEIHVEVERAGVVHRLLYRLR
jgi:hypothetical protein